MNLTARSLGAFAICSCLWAAPADVNVSGWQPIGPFGGDARSLVASPKNFGHLFIGTSNSEVYASADGGRQWHWLSEIAPRHDLVIGRLLVHPSDPKVMYAGAYTTGNGEGGGVYRSKDSGKTWKEQPDMYGQSVRALTMSPVDPKVMVAGTLEGVFKTIDGGEYWKRISPEHHDEIRNIESIALDPAEPDAVYAGTWHLPWKTSDGGKTWLSIKEGIIDDSDVFTITVDWSNHETAYLGACSGIYRTDNAGSQWRKIQGIPFSARRTRAMRQDPQRAETVYAGTTEGLWKTEDGGRSWTHTTASSLIINEVLIDPRDSKHLFLATDRGGVLESHDGGSVFQHVNTGFSHRLIWRLIGSDTELIASVRHDKEFGGVFTRGASSDWQALEKGLNGNDVLALVRLPSGDLLAGTAVGMFRYAAGKESGQVGGTTVGAAWEPTGSVFSSLKNPVGRAALPPGPLTAEIYDFALTGGVLFAATDHGILRSNDSGVNWLPVTPPFLANLVAASPDVLAVAQGDGIRISKNSGASWFVSPLPILSRVYGLVAVGRSIWAATDHGLFRSPDSGANWEAHGRGVPIGATYDVVVDEQNPKHVFVGSAMTELVYESHDGGDSYEALPPTGFSGSRPRRLAIGPGGKLYLASGYDGVFSRSLSSVAR